MSSYYISQIENMLFDSCSLQNVTEIKLMLWLMFQVVT